jgi:hypothetical protein
LQYRNRVQSLLWTHNVLRSGFAGGIVLWQVAVFIRPATVLGRRSWLLGPI